MAVPKKTTVKKAITKKRPVKKKQTSQSRWAWRIFFAFVILILLSPFYYGYVLRIFSATWGWISDAGENPHYRTYKSFQIRMPVKYKIHGIDVSYAQGKIDWQKVRAMHEDSVSISFAFVKATEGVLGVDPYFQRNWREAPKVGIVCGAYHFLHPNKSGAWQARLFLQTVKMEAGDLPAVADIERLDGVSPETMRKELKAFLKHVEQKTGIKPIIYTNLSFYVDNLAGYFEGYPLWLAHYHEADLAVSKKTNWWFWQHSDIARVNGINHTVDFNAFKGDSLSFQNLLIK